MVWDLHSIGRSTLKAVSGVVLPELQDSRLCCVACSFAPLGSKALATRATPCIVCL